MQPNPTRGSQLCGMPTQTRWANKCYLVERAFNINLWTKIDYLETYIYRTIIENPVSSIHDVELCKVLAWREQIRWQSSDSTPEPMAHHDWATARAWLN